MACRVDVHKASLNAMGYDGLEHWLENPWHVYVGRNVAYVKGAKQHEFANVFAVKKYGRDECIRMYEAWLIEVLQDPEVRTRFESIKGKTLGCWCGANDACHADVIIRMLKKADHSVTLQFASSL